MSLITVLRDHPALYRTIDTYRPQQAEHRKICEKEKFSEAVNTNVKYKETLGGDILLEPCLTLGL